MWRFVFAVIVIVVVALPLLLNGEVNDDNDDDVVEIDIESGRIRGKRSLTLYEKKPYYSFRGIPYAQPPTKDLRFKVSWSDPPYGGHHCIYEFADGARIPS